MGFREEYGSLVEDVLNGLVEKHLDAEAVKLQLHKLIDDLVDSKLILLKDGIKEAIDKIDGEVG